MNAKKATKKTAAKKAVADKKTGASEAPFTVKASVAEQEGNSLYVFTAKASMLFSMLSINRRVEDKKEGYQRTLSVSRVAAISNYLKSGGVIPGAIVVSFDAATFDAKSGVLTVPSGEDVGWVIDGQHRLAGAAEAAGDGTDVDLPVVALLGLGEVQQVEMFVTINREAKNVPTSLYLDLLRILPLRKAGDVAKERAADIGSMLKQDESSPFFRRIVVTTSPKSGELSLTNFARKVSPIVTQDRGILGAYTVKEQAAVIANYYHGLRQVFPAEYDSQGSIFFKTLGFGALFNVLPAFFSMVLRERQAFQVQDVVAVFKKIENFTFDSWREYGTGTAAEMTAGDDLKTALLLASQSSDGQGILRT